MKNTKSSSNSQTRNNGDPLGDLIVAIFGPFIGAILLLISPFFISNHEQQCGRVKLLKDCWLQTYEAQNSDETALNNGEYKPFNECVDGYFVHHSGTLKGCKFYEFGSTDVRKSDYLSIRRKSYYFAENEWKQSQDYFNNEMESYYNFDFPAFCNYAVLGDVGETRLTIAQIQHLESQQLVEDVADFALLTEYKSHFTAMYGNHVIHKNEVYVFNNPNSSLDHFNDGDIRFEYSFKKLRDADQAATIYSFGLKYYEHIIPFQYYDFLKMPPIYTSFSPSYSLSNYLIENDHKQVANKDYVENMEDKNKLGIEQPDWFMKKFTTIYYSGRESKYNSSTCAEVTATVDGQLVDKIFITRIIIFVVFCMLPHNLCAAPLFYIFRALWIIGFIPGLLMFLLCITAAAGWYMFVSGFVYIPYSVISSVCCTIVGLAIFVGSWLLSYLMVNGLVNGAVSVWGAITGSH